MSSMVEMDPTQFGATHTREPRLARNIPDCYSLRHGCAYDSKSGGDRIWPTNDIVFSASVCGVYNVEK